MVGGLAAGGLLGVLLGNKKLEEETGNSPVESLAMAAPPLSALLLFRLIRTGRAASPFKRLYLCPPTPGLPVMEPTLPRPLRPARNLIRQRRLRTVDRSGLALVLAMIGAANADGHIDADEQAIFERVSATELEAAEKGFVFDALAKPPSLQEVADFADGPEQGAEIYLASRLAIDPDHPMEHAYMEALAARLSSRQSWWHILESQIAQMAG